jgi:hypothetical protein
MQPSEVTESLDEVDYGDPNGAKPVVHIYGQVMLSNEETAICSWMFKGVAINRRRAAHRHKGRRSLNISIVEEFEIVIAEPRFVCLQPTLSDNLTFI